MINQKIIKALKIINQKLKDQKIKWVLVGSTSLALQGVKIKPKDIDILTNREGAYEVNKLLKEYEIKPIKFGKSNVFQSYLGEFRVNKIKVEVMGNLKEKIGGKWESLSPRLKSPKIIKIEGMNLPVSPLKEQLKSYKFRGRKKDSIRVQRIKEALKRRAKVRSTEARYALLGDVNLILSSCTQLFRLF
ncbi:MAG: hypothetical protein ABH874_07215 [Methanobacteriota archaeon]